MDGFDLPNMLLMMGVYDNTNSTITKTEKNVTKKRRSVISLSEKDKKRMREQLGLNKPKPERPWSALPK